MHGVVPAHGGQHHPMNRFASSRRSAISRIGAGSAPRSTLLINTTNLAPAGTPLRPPSGCARTPATISGVIGAPSATPLSALTSSGRCTFASSSVLPKTSAPTTATTIVVSMGITGSCAAGALNGRMREPSASFRMHTPGYQARRRRKAPARRRRPGRSPASVAPMTSTWPCAASAAESAPASRRRQDMGGRQRDLAGKDAGGRGRDHAAAPSTISPARRNMAVVFPPPPTNATTSSGDMSSASPVSPGTRPVRVEASSAPGAGRRALDQILRAGLDPGEEAGHHDAHAHLRVALDVGRADERPATRPDCTIFLIAPSIVFWTSGWPMLPMWPIEVARSLGATKKTSM